jgi:hypothetical protein
MALCSLVVGNNVFGGTYTSVLKVEAVCSTKMFLPIHHNPEDHNMNLHICGELRPYINDRRLEKLNNEYVKNLYYLPNITRLIESRKI